jgi:hypothetical protein
LSDKEGINSNYLITRLASYVLSDDFAAMHISHCTLIADHSRVYLSLDPHTEGTESVKDNLTFIGFEIIAC